VDNPKRIYELLLDYCSSVTQAEKILIGLVWTLCKGKDSIGLAMSPQIATRTLAWSGDLAGKPLTDLAAGILAWEPYQATVAMAAINCCLNARPLPDSIALGNRTEQANLAVFDHFLPQLQGKNVVVIGRYPGLENYQNQFDMQVIELQSGTSDYPAAACEYLLSTADWVFLTASSIPNKTFPRLAELSRNATTVLMGPTTPWLPQLHEFGIDYLAGVEITDCGLLERTIAEGGGKRIFSNGLRYRIAELTPELSMNWLKREITDCAAEKTKLTQEMDAWYGQNQSVRYPQYGLLEQTNARLSRMDSSYKLLWDQHHVGILSQ
jgi:uncharacterized protein